MRTPILALLKLRKVGGTYVLTVPKEAAHKLQIDDGDMFTLRVPRFGTPRLLYEKQGGKRR